MRGLTTKAAETIEEVVRRLGVPGTCQGMRALIWGVDLVLGEPELLYAVTKELYPAVGEKCRTGWKSVERNLRTAVSICWERGNRPLLDEMAGFPLQVRPTVGEFIDYIAHYIKVNRLL